MCCAPRVEQLHAHNSAAITTSKSSGAAGCGDPLRIVRSSADRVLVFMDTSLARCARAVNR